MDFSSYFTRRGLRNKAASAHARITLTRGTTAFFVFSFIYCFIQGIIQSLLFSTDVGYGTLVSGIVSESGMIARNQTTYLEGSTGHLLVRMCNDVPHGQKIFPCFTIFNSTSDNPKFNESLAQFPFQQVRTLGDWESGLRMATNFDEDNQPISISLTVNGINTDPTTLSKQCVQDLTYTSQILDNLKREDISWICLQFWLLAVSFLAILNDSVPHVLTVLMTRTTSTAWSTYAIWRGPYFEAHWQEMIGDAGTPCSLDLFHAFWSTRRGFEIADLILSASGLVFFFCLSWKLLKIYNDQSFKCVGAPEHIMRINKFFMAVLACLQMEAFVLITSGGLWIDVLMTTAIVKISAHTVLYQALFITTTVLLLPWIAMVSIRVFYITGWEMRLIPVDAQGWYSIRREMKVMMIIFLTVGLFLIAGWATMFYSIVYRWSFLQWPFLGCFTVSSFILLISSMTLGIVCRVNFGKGLAQYLHAESTLESLNFAPDNFAVRTNSMNAKDIESKGDPGDYADDSDFTHTFLIRTLPSLPSNQPQPQTKDDQYSPKEERSFFTV